MKKSAVLVSVLVVCITGFVGIAEADKPAIENQNGNPNGIPFQKIYDSINDLQDQIDNGALVGPPGPQGEQGIQGLQGVQGPRGEKGEPGSPSWDEGRIAELEARILYLESLIEEPSQSGWVANFDSSLSQRFSITDNQQTGLDLSNAFTIELWVKLEVLLQFNDDYAILRKWNDGKRAYAFGSQVSYDVQKLMFKISSNGDNQEIVTVDWNPIANTWYHLAVTYNGSLGEIKFYVNGSQLGSTQIVSISLVNNSDDVMYIGSAVYCDYFDGKMDDLRIWSEARTQEEIFANMSNELTGNEPNLEGYWQFNGNALDSSPNSNHLTNTNGVSFVED